MEYTALYRKYRPLKFEDMVGQDLIVKTLKNEVQEGRVGHSYLFCGERGTGKTSAAKILARAVNCLHPVNGEPCNECEICKAALEGSLSDIVEMDAASNNSVDNIRDIRDEVNFLPTTAKYRVYIIDEVHMLSSGAFNALLKTLEEPPAHVKFILATTEPQKLLATIISRCQRFDFKKISNEDLVRRLEYICKDSNIDAEKDALNLIATLAEGGARDALSILERCSQEKEKITEEKVRTIVGMPKIALISKLVNSLIEKNESEVLSNIDDIIKEGKDLTAVLWEIIKYLKNMIVVKANGTVNIYTEDEITELKALSEKVDKSSLLNMITELSNLDREMKWSTQRTILFQVGLLKLCNLSNNSTSNIKQYEVGSATASIDSAELLGIKSELTKLKELIKSSRNDEYNAMLKGDVPQEKKAQLKEIKISKDSKLENWGDILGTLNDAGKKKLYHGLQGTEAVQLDDMTIGISKVAPICKDILNMSDEMHSLEQEISLSVGKPMRIKVLDDNTVIKYINETDKQIQELQNDVSGIINIIED